MRKNAILGLMLSMLIVIVSVFTHVPVQAESGGFIFVPGDVYDQMLEHMANQEFQDVVNLCEQLEDYKDSRLYWFYAKGRLSVDQGGFEEASMYFSALSYANFQDSAAWSEYASGMSCYNKQDFAAAIPHFEGAQGVADSTQKLVECYTAIKSESTSSLSSPSLVDSTVDSLRIAWKDAEPGHRYVVHYMPRYVLKDPAEVATDSPEVTLTGLIPGTEYTVQVSSIDGMPAQTLEFNAATKPADAGQVSPFSSRDLALFRFDRNDEKKYSLSKLVEFSKTFMTELNDGIISLPNSPVMQSNIGHVLVSLLYVDDGQVQGSHSATAVLRLAKAGVYRTQSSFEVSGTSSKYIGVYLSIDEMLDKVYAQQEAWPQADGSIELYVDGVLMGSISLSLG